MTPCIEERYEWLVALLKKEFPNNEIIGKGFDYGSQFGIAINSAPEHTHRSAVRVEYDYVVGGFEATEYLPTGGTISHTEDGQRIKYSLNELSTENKTLAVGKIITAFKKVAA
jgi:hypothetical protein